MDPVEVGLYSVVDLTKKRRNKLKSECKGDILPFPASVEDIDKKSAHTAGRITGYGSQGQPTNAAEPPSPIYAVVDLSKKQRKSIKSKRVAVERSKETERDGSTPFLCTPNADGGSNAQSGMQAKNKRPFHLVGNTCEEMTYKKPVKYEYEEIDLQHPSLTSSSTPSSAHLDTPVVSNPLDPCIPSASSCLVASSAPAESGMEKSSHTGLCTSHSVPCKAAEDIKSPVLQEIFIDSDTECPIEGKELDECDEAVDRKLVELACTEGLVIVTVILTTLTFLMCILIITLLYRVQNVSLGASDNSTQLHVQRRQEESYSLPNNSCYNTSECLYSVDEIRSSFQLLHEAQLKRVNSCSTLLPFSSLSGYYLLSSSISNSSIRVYCDLDFSCGDIHGGWARLYKWERSVLEPDCLWNLVDSDISMNTCTSEQNLSLNFSLADNLNYSKLCVRVKSNSTATSNDSLPVNVSSSSSLGVYLYGINQTLIDTCPDDIYIQQCFNSNNSPSCCNNTVPDSALSWNRCASFNASVLFFKNLSPFATSNPIEVDILDTAVKLNIVEVYVL